MQYRYGREWNPWTREPIDEITEDQARQRWQNGPAFSVSRLGDEAQVPDWTLVVRPGGDYVKVEHYDPDGSVVEVQHWNRERGGDGLFLAQLTTYVYVGGATTTQDLMDAVAHRTWRFWPDGRARCRETITSQPAARVSEYREVDVSSHWVPAPTFGEWDRWGAPLDDTMGGPLVAE